MFSATVMGRDGSIANSCHFFFGLLWLAVFRRGTYSNYLNITSISVLKYNKMLPFLFFPVWNYLAKIRPQSIVPLLVFFSGHF
jgi:hypothetical protein